MNWRRHLLRFAGSLAASGFTFLGFSMAVVTFISVRHTDSRLFSLILGIFIIGVICWVLQAVFEYGRKTQDPTWVLKYQEMWDKSTGWRNTAARVLQNHREHLSEIDSYKELADIDEVLDILEDIGFYMMSDHITPETARHHFGYWIRGYWCASRAYVEAWQQRDPSRWRHIKSLYEAVSTAKGGREKPQAIDIGEFLTQEANVRPPV